MKFLNLIKEENIGLSKQMKDAFNNAKRSGKIKQPKKCSKCGKEFTYLEFHHTSYKDPFDGVWLCKSCHGIENKKQSRKRGAMGKYNPTGKYPKKY